MTPISTIKQGIGFGSLSVASNGFLTLSQIVSVVLKRPIAKRMPLSFHNGTRFLLNNQFNK